LPIFSALLLAAVLALAADLILEHLLPVEKFPVQDRRKWRY